MTLRNSNTVNAGQNKSTRCETVQCSDSLYTCLVYGQGTTTERKGTRAGGRNLETTLLVNNIGVFLILFRANPHLFKCRETSQDATADPSAVLALWWRVYFDLHILDSELLHLVEETVAKPYAGVGESLW